MKLLFISEGPHDVGANPNSRDPRPAQGVIPTLAHRVIGDIIPESVALAWREIPRFNPNSQKAGFPAKIAGAVLLSQQFGCVGTVVVADRDGKDDRQSALAKGAEAAHQLFTSHPVVWGLAVQSVEAWTLGVPEHIAEVLEVDVNVVKQHYPSGVHVESLLEQSGKPDHRPKGILDRIAQLKHREDSTEFRQAIAERTDVERLAQACPKGFGPFLERLRSAFARGRV